MDQGRFDTLARGLATNRFSRGQVLKGFVASLFVGLLPACEREGIEAASDCRRLGANCTGNLPVLLKGLL